MSAPEYNAAAYQGAGGQLVDAAVPVPWPPVPRRTRRGNLRFTSGLVAQPGRFTLQLAQRAADAMNCAQYWKAGAEKATRKHNTHIEKCNRVIEAGESGLPAADTAGAGALRQQIKGMSQKASYYSCVPLCADCHTQAPGAYHRAGKGTFERRHGLSFAGIVARLNREWPARCA